MRRPGTVVHPFDTMGGMSKQTTSAAQRRIAASVASHGFAIMAVGYGQCMEPGCCGGQRSRQPWAYSIGLVERGQPELVMLGHTARTAHDGMSWVLDRFDMGLSVPVNAIDPLDDFGLKLVDVPFDWLWTDPGRMAMWFVHYDSGPFSTQAPDVRQILWADNAGRFPDDPQCDPKVVAAQPVLSIDPISYPKRDKPHVNPARHRKKPRR